MASSTGPGRARLRKLVGASKEAKPRLPLVHSTDSFTFEDILDAGVIAPQPCDVFKGETLIYAFYGRPAFRPNAEAEPISLTHYFPVCLILRPSFTAAISRIFPFDSGAFHGGHYSAYVHAHMRLSDFGLDPLPSTPGKVVTGFFGSAHDYLLGKASVKTNLDPSEFEALSLAALIEAKGSNHLDGRSAAVEVQLSQEISIADAVCAIALPTSFVDGRTGRKLKKLGIDLLPYRTFERSKPDDYTTDIANLCIAYYAKLKLIAEMKV